MKHRGRRSKLWPTERKKALTAGKASAGERGDVRLEPEKRFSRPVREEEGSLRGGRRGGVLPQVPSEGERVDVAERGL